MTSVAVSLNIAINLLYKITILCFAFILILKVILNTAISKFVVVLWATITTWRLDYSQPVIISYARCVRWFVLG